MKVSLNWIRAMLDLQKSPTEIADILTSLGLEVESIETVSPSEADLDKILSARVLTCERIPDTDHLSATKVDVGDGVIRSVVCGAPNVAAGQMVFVALPGARVLSKDGARFSIAERKVKGVPSQGMICAVDEMGLGTDHSGIFILPPDTPQGLSAADFYQLESDTILDIGLTPNRADATCHLGVARDIAAYLRVREGKSAPIRLPETTNIQHHKGQSVISVDVEVPNSCPRYCGLCITGVTVTESPDWMKNRLLALGQRPINNIVDITNWVRMEMGQPLHAFDIAAIAQNKLVVKTLPEGTPFKGLDGAERHLSVEDIMICDGNDNPLCMGGVFGGESSGVRETTTDIFLESALFHPKAIRKSMIRHNLRTDAAWTFEKGVDPLGCILALERAAYLILQTAGGSISGPTADFHPQPAKNIQIPISFERINQHIGAQFENTQIIHILNALEIQTDNISHTGLTASVPTNKPDVRREADVIEEILRVYGLDNIPIPSRFRTSMEITSRPSPEMVRNTAADLLAANGCHECMSLSLTNSTYFVGDQAALPIPQDQLVYVHNTANQGLDCMRPVMLFSALETIVRNQNRQHPDLRLFEIGKTYLRNIESPSFHESYRLSISLSGNWQSEHWQKPAKTKTDFFTLKGLVNLLLHKLGVAEFQETAVAESPYQYAVKYHRGAQEIATFGAVDPTILKKMDVRNEVFFADVNLTYLTTATRNNTIHSTELNKYPSVRRDLALVIPQAIQFNEIKILANKTAKKLLKNICLFDVFEDESKLGVGKKSYAVSFTFEDPEKTLQEQDIDSVMQDLQKAFENKLNAAIRK